MKLYENKFFNKGIFIFVMILFMTTGCEKDDQYYIDLTIEEHNLKNQPELNCYVDERTAEEVEVICHYKRSKQVCGPRYDPWLSTHSSYGCDTVWESATTSEKYKVD